MTEQKKDELQEIFESMKLDETIFTPEVMDKVKLIVESKVNERLEEEKEKLEEANKAELKEFKDDMIDNFDEYMNYFAEEFTKKNEEDIISSVKIKTAERILENFNTMVNDFNMSLSEETVDQSSKIEELESDLNEAVNEKIALKQEINEANKYALILDRVMKLDTDAEKSRFAKLAESFDFEDEDTFNSKLDTLQESLGETTTETEELEESETYKEDTEILTESTDTSGKNQYLKVLHRTA